MRPHRFVVLIAVMASLMSLGMAMPGAAAGAAGIASIKLDPAVGPPTTKVKIRGIGFGPAEQVLITFDGTKVGTATTNSSGGGFSTRIKVPRSAVPGDHTVTA